MIKPAGPFETREPFFARNFVVVLTIAAALTAIAFVVSLSHGPNDISLATFVESVVAHDGGDDSHMIARDIRMPRALVGLIVGGSLAAAGAVMQGVTRNPLASPSIMGLSSGASLAVLVAMLYLPALSYNGTILASMAGAGLGYGSVLAVASLSPGGFGPARLALAGTVVSALFGAVLHGLIIHHRMASDMLYWTVGGIATVGWPQVLAVLPFCMVGLFGVLCLASSITVLSLGNEVAVGLGQSLFRVRTTTTLCVLLLTGSAVAVAGPVGFIGLMVPHVCRLLVGSDYRRLIPLSFVVGAGLTECADIAARSILGSWQEVPLGVLTAALGAPCFIWLIQRRLENRLEGGLTLQSSAVKAPPSWRLVMPILVACLVVVFWARLQFGYMSLSPATTLQTLLGHGTPGEELMLLSFRLPRAVFAVLAGAGIAVAGAMFQSILRNDLAEPGILGVSAGANLAIVLVLATMTRPVMASVFFLPASAVGGAMAAMLFVYLLCLGARYSSIRLLLTGVAVSSALGAFTLLITLQLSERIYKFAVAFTAGSLSTADWNYVAVLAAWLGVAIPLAWSHAPTLNVLRTGDETASGLGVAVGRQSLFLLGVAVASCAACMALSGGIMFLGLIAPHIARRVVGPNHTLVIPAAGLIGATLLLLADVTGNTLFSTELPAGVVVSALGAPYFLYLLARS
ncbi:MAG: iron ABC transporter permease [Pirellulales bacterium]